MDALTRIGWIGFIALVLAVSGCGGGGGGDGGGGGTQQSGAVVGTAGGTVVGPNGAKVVIPAGALATNTTINIAQIAASTAVLPVGFSVSGQMFAFTPHGTTFAVPVTMTLPFNPASVPAGTTPQFYKTNAQFQWEQITNATFGADTATAQVTSFSDAAVVIPPVIPPVTLDSGSPLRFWNFFEFRGDELAQLNVSGDVNFGGLLEEFFDHGPAQFDPAFSLADGTIIPSDGIATSHIMSTANGVTYSVLTSAPGVDDELLGSKAELIQVNSYTKNAADATYEFTLSAAVLDVRDGNSILGRECVPARNIGITACDIIKAEVFLDVHAVTTVTNPITNIQEEVTLFHTKGGATLNGGATGFAGTKVSWFSDAWNEAVSKGTPLWTTENFDFVVEDFNGPEGHLVMKLSKPRTYRVDLSEVAVGKNFDVVIRTHALAYNRTKTGKSTTGPNAEFETAANAFLRDPLTIGGTTVITTGLTPIATPLPFVPPVEVPVPPAACVPGPAPDPAAGVLQFNAASYTLAETSTTPTITVTRTGGSKGAVTATFTTSDGSAISGTDYTPVNSTVFFADGDAAPRVVRVPIIQDLLSGEPDKTVILTLSQPGGCAALGASIAALTIRDDDVPPPPSRFTVGGTVTGLIGTRLVLIDHHFMTLEVGNGPFTFSNIPTLSGEAYSVRIDLQPINPTQFCTVTNGTGTFTDHDVTDVVVNCV